jgi:hypothetical protein
MVNSQSALDERKKRVLGVESTVNLVKKVRMETVALGQNSFK